MGLGLATWAIGWAAAAGPPAPMLVWADRTHWPAGLPLPKRDTDIAILLRVEADGSKQCTAANKAAPRGLPRASCVLVAGRWPYLPARDGAGTFVASDVPVTVRWKAETPPSVDWDGAVPIAPDGWLTAADLPKVAAPIRVTFAFKVSTGGKVSSCVLEAASASPDIDGLICGLIQKRAAFLPALDVGGMLRVATVRWSMTVPAK